jgi:peptide-methionine (S)-S-oxide reductase
MSSHRVLAIFLAVCMLSSSLRLGRGLFTGARAMSMSMSGKATFGAGCYWGTEKFFKEDFGTKLVPSSKIKGLVGFMGTTGKEKENPSYREVCSGQTGHVEVYDFTFEGDETTYEALVKHFFAFHDPTTPNRQGNDVGTQYASVIFYYDDKQKEIAERVKAELNDAVKSGKVKNYQQKEVSTAIVKAQKFYAAEAEHQEYLAKQPWGYCNHAYRFMPTEWPVQSS